MNGNESYIIDARRTAIGRFGESPRDIPARTLAAIVMRAVMDSAWLAPAAIEEVIMGHVIQAGANFVARSAAVDAGIPVDAPGSTVNQVCASGLSAIMQADRLVRCGDREIVLAGGVESMSSAPYISRSTRWGSRYGAAQLDDELTASLTCSITGLAMGQTAENVAARHTIGRDEQDAWALRSHERALDAIAAGRFRDEIVAVPVPQRKGAAVLFDTDEHPRATSLELLAKLPAAFAGGGSVTAGNSAGINDGAAAVIVASKAAVERHGLTPMARIVSSAVTGIEPEIMGLGPVKAITQALAKAGLGISDIDLFEINEAFAAQILGVFAELPIDPDNVNVNGGAIALGHPIGCSGARVTVTLLHELRRRGGRYGLASLCVGGGMGAAMVVERV